MLSDYCKSVLSPAHLSCIPVRRAVQVLLKLSIHVFTLLTLFIEFIMLLCGERGGTAGMFILHIRIVSVLVCNTALHFKMYCKRKSLGIRLL